MMSSVADMDHSVKSSLKGFVFILLFTATLATTCCSETTYFYPSKVRDCKCGSAECMCDLGIFVLHSFLKGILYVGLDQPMSTKDENYSTEKLTYKTYNNKIMEIKKGENISPSSCIVNSTTALLEVVGSFPFVNIVGDYHLVIKSFPYVERVGSYNYTLYKNKFAMSFYCTAVEDNGRTINRITGVEYTSTPKSIITTLNDPTLDSFSSYAHKGIKHTVNVMLKQVLLDEMQKGFNDLPNIQ